MSHQADDAPARVNADTKQVQFLAPFGKHCGV